VYKKGQKYNPENYHPIHNSIVYVKEECETLSKAFEKSKTKISVCFPFSMLRVTSSINSRS
jgi:hypothetical protein